MAQNDAVFTGSIPQLYDEHMGALLFAPYAGDLAKRLSGMTEGDLLETAAGTGIVTQALATRLAPAVRLTATDLNQPMLDHAAKKPGVGRVEFKQADAQALLEVLTAWQVRAPRRLNRGEHRAAASIAAMNPLVLYFSRSSPATK